MASYYSIVEAVAVHHRHHLPADKDLRVAGKELQQGRVRIVAERSGILDHHSFAEFCMAVLDSLGYHIVD